MTCVDESSGYHNPKSDQKSSQLIMLACQFGRYRYTRLLFKEVLVSDMFKQKPVEIFRGVSSIFGIGDDILIVGYNADGRNHDKTLR